MTRKLNIFCRMGAKATDNEEAKFSRTFDVNIALTAARKCKCYTTVGKKGILS